MLNLLIDTLARLSIYMLSNPSPALAPLLTRLFTTKTVPETLITILLDWSDPWKWPHQLRQWIRLLRSVLITLEDDVKVTMEENMTEWKEKRKGVDAPTGNFGPQATKDGVPAPAVTLGPGEWDEGLGMPLCVVCQNAERIERLEKEFTWDEGEFDFIAQWMRTVLLKRKFRNSVSPSTPPEPSPLHRRRIMHLHYSVRYQLGPPSNPRLPGHPLPPKTRNRQIQHRRPRQTPHPSKLGLLG